jgi:hypothetical protein
MTSNKSEQPGLYTFHRILIIASVGLAGLMVFWGIQDYRSTRGLESLAVALGASGVCVALSIYLVRFNKKTRRVGDGSCVD